MSVRIRTSKFLLRLGAFIQSLPIVIMKADDLVEFSRQTYAEPDSVNDWSEEIIINAGLNPYEIDLVKVMTSNRGKLLLLGIGGGREAIPFATMGFQVTGVDYIPAMVERAKQNAEKHGVYIEGLVQEISRLDVPEASFDVIWISRAMYSCVPTRTRRIRMLQKIKKALKPDGTFFCLFYANLDWKNDGKGERLRQIIAASPFGNKEYTYGDFLSSNLEFVHIFTSESEICSELEEGGFHITQIMLNSSANNCGAVCAKAIEI
jgi:SAM-dependent methyltransferase